MKCKTIDYYDVSGTAVYKDKQKFDTLDDAIRIAKIVNSGIDRTTKIVAYKCKYCHFYHIGKNGRVLKDKDKERIKNQRKFVI